jgi:two-component system sensor histidine kinase DegS
LKHAKARDLIVKLEFRENRVSLTVQDNGIGFDFQNSNGTKHFGLLGMKERVDFIKGDLNITSQPGAGTTVKLTV